MKNYREAKEIKLVYSGEDYFNVLEEMIDNSREILHLQTYIFQSDETGLRIVAALKRAAARKVKIFMLVDAYGSYPFSKDTATQLTESGINFRLYSPLFSSESVFFGRRLHHKIIVADREVSLTGGINIADKYSGKNQENAWLDYAILCKGEVCEYLHLLCDSFYTKGSSSLLKKFEAKKVDSSVHEKMLVRFRRNDWIKGKNEIHKSYVEAIINSKKCITIVASYFLPGRTFRNLLKEAANRGVKINIILAGQSDIPSLRLAEHFMYEFYLKNRINIYEWTNSVMHGKAMVVDDEWATIGSYNLNFLSHYVSIELNTDTTDPEFVKTFTSHLHNIIQNNCERIDQQKLPQTNNLFQRFKMWVAYRFYKSLMHFMMTGTKYKNKKH